jgi:hypothetical protein
LLPNAAKEIFRSEETVYRETHWIRALYDILVDR